MICILFPLVYFIFIVSPLLYLICLLTAGFDPNDLTLRPTDQHLVRLAGLVPHHKFDDLVIHLGLSKDSCDNIKDQYREYGLKAVNFVALCEWRHQQTKKMKKTSFKDLSDALIKVGYNQHVLCQVGNN